MLHRRNCLQTAHLESRCTNGRFARDSATPVDRAIEKDSSPTCTNPTISYPSATDEIIWCCGYIYIHPVTRGTEIEYLSFDSIMVILVCT